MLFRSPVWTPSYAALILVMWIVMMIAMMLPSAAPAILLAAALTRQAQGSPGQGSRGQSAVWLFALGYLAVWSAFSVFATALQWGLDAIGQLSETMASNNAAREIAAERLILEREKLGGLDPLAYVGSKIIFLGAFVLAQSLWMGLFVEMITGGLQIGRAHV